MMVETCCPTKTIRIEWNFRNSFVQFIEVKRIDNVGKIVVFAYNFRANKREILICGAVQSAGRNVHSTPIPFDSKICSRKPDNA